MQTLVERWGSLAGKRIAFVGDGNNVCTSLVHAAMMLGIGVNVATPKGFELPDEVVDQAAEVSQKGAGLTEFTDPKAAVRDVDAIYTDVWTSMGQEVEYAERKKTFKRYQVNESMMALAKSGAPYENEAASPGAVASVRIGDVTVVAFDGGDLSAADFKERTDAFGKQLTTALKTAGYPLNADPAQINHAMVLLILTVLVLYVTMVYGPIAAWLVELFPARIRYTSMSLPYHIGNGWFGGFLPTVSFALVALTGDIYYGLWYPSAVALVTVVIGALFLPEKRGDEVMR
jgi:hypothetical protein